jgi:hypothetical protein
MSDYRAQITRRRGPEEKFVGSRYSRAHEWTFDGGLIVPAVRSEISVAGEWSYAAG